MNSENIYLTNCFRYFLLRTSIFLCTMIMLFRFWQNRLKVQLQVRFVFVVGRVQTERYFWSIFLRPTLPWIQKIEDDNGIYTCFSIWKHTTFTTTFNSFFVTKRFGHQYQVDLCWIFDNKTLIILLTV